MVDEWVFVILPWGLFFAGVLWLLRRRHAQRAPRERANSSAIDPPPSSGHGRTSASSDAGPPD